MMRLAIFLAVCSAVIHVAIALVLGYVARTFMLWHLDDGDAFALTQLGWVRTAELRALPWQILGVVLAFGFFLIGRACVVECVDERDEQIRRYAPWAVALSGFAALCLSLSVSGIEFIIEKPYF